MEDNTNSDNVANPQEIINPKESQEKIAGSVPVKIDANLNDVSEESSDEKELREIEEKIREAQKEINKLKKEGKIFEIEEKIREYQAELEELNQEEQ